MFYSFVCECISGCTAAKVNLVNFPVRWLTYDVFTRTRIFIGVFSNELGIGLCFFTKYRIVYFVIRDSAFVHVITLDSIWLFLFLNGLKCATNSTTLTFSRLDQRFPITLGQLSVAFYNIIVLKLEFDLRN